jgi:hypothetical protein
VRVRALLRVRDRVEPVHHRLDPFGHEQLHRVGCPTDGLFDHRPLGRVEPCEHVIGEITALVSPPHPHAQPRIRVGAEVPGDRLQSVVAAGGSAGPRPQPPHRQRHVVGHDEQVLGRDPKIPQEGPRRLAAQVHHRERFDEQHVPRRRPPAGDQRVGRCALEVHSCSPGNLVGDAEPDIVPGVAVRGPGIAEADDQLHPSTPRKPGCSKCTLSDG